MKVAMTRPARRGRAAGGVRRHDRARVRPQAVAGRQRLGVGHVEAGAADEALVERGQQVVAEDDVRRA